MYSENDENPLEWFVTSGIIQLRHTRKEDIMERTIQVTKIWVSNTVNKFIQ